MLPVMRANIGALLRDEAFKEVLLELPDLNFRLLAMLDSAPTPKPALKKARLDVSDSDSGEEDEDALFQDVIHSRFGRGRTLG